MSIMLLSGLNTLKAKVLHPAQAGYDDIIGTGNQPAQIIQRYRYFNNGNRRDMTLEDSNDSGVCGQQAFDSVRCPASTVISGLVVRGYKFVGLRQCSYVVIGNAPAKRCPGVVVPFPAPDAITSSGSFLPIVCICRRLCPFASFLRGTSRRTRTLC